MRDTYIEECCLAPLPESVGFDVKSCLLTGISCSESEGFIGDR